MSATAVNLFCAFAILLAAVQAATLSEVHSKPQVASVEVNAAAATATHHAHHALHAHHAHHDKKKGSHGPLHSLVKGDAQEDWHAHGEDGSQWRWVKSTGGAWERRAITEDEAKQADPPAQPPARAAEHAAATPTCTIKGTGKVNIDVYYETRCPGCLMFIAKTLEPLWRTKGLQDFLNVTLYTYGNAESKPVSQISEGYKFFHEATTGKGFDTVQICQHGPDECFGNLVQLCAKDIAEHSKYMELVFCMTRTTMLGYAEENGAYQCLDLAKVDKDKVRECVAGARGNELAAEAGRQTDLLKARTGTPWVMMAGGHVADDALMNHTVLAERMCSHFCDAPEPCKGFVKKAASAPAHAAPAPTPSADDFTVLTTFATDDEFVTKDDFFQVSRDHV